jgi:hypothetical protein
MEMVAQEKCDVAKGAVTFNPTFSHFILFYKRQKLTCLLVKHNEGNESYTRISLSN